MAEQRFALLAATRIVAVSRYTEALLVELGVPEDRIRIVHPGCDVNRFGPVGVSDELRARVTQGRAHQHLILTVGNLVERKGHDTVIRALPLLPKGANDVLYLIAGDGPYRAALEKLAADLGVASQVLFLGRVPSDELPLLYSLADSFVMVSRQRLDACDVEGFGIVFIEAAACGKPAIGGRSGGVQDAIVDGVTGLLVDPLDSAAVANAITSLLLNPGLRERLGTAARERALRHFTWSRFTDNVAAILEEVHAEHGRVAPQ